MDNSTDFYFCLDEESWQDSQSLSLLSCDMPYGSTTGLIPHQMQLIPQQGLNCMNMLPGNSMFIPEIQFQ